MSDNRFVDVNAWAGTWPFGSGESFALADVIADQQRVGVHEAWISPLGAVLAAHPGLANANLIAEAGAVPVGAFTLGLAPVIDPSLADWQDQLAAVVALVGDRANTVNHSVSTIAAKSGRSWGPTPCRPGLPLDQLAVVGHDAKDHLRAIRIVPNYHAYALDHPAVDALAKALVERSLPLIVQVRMLDERAHHPRMVVPPVPVTEIAELGRRHPDLCIIASGIFFGELAAIADVPNVCVELSSIETGETLPGLLGVVSLERIVLGTHAPLYVPDAAIAKLDGIANDTLTAIGEGNALRLIQPSPSMEGNRS